MTAPQVAPTIRAVAEGLKGNGSGSRVVVVMERALSRLVTVTLRHSNYETRDCTNDPECRELLRDWDPHLAIVDIDNYEWGIEAFGGGMAQGKIPVLAFTRRRATSVKLRAFERGADDVVEVPFTLDEIVARPYALIRRSRGLTTTLTPKITLGGQLQVDLIEQTVKLNGSGPLELTPIQQTLLYILAANAGDVLTREMILASVWGSDFQIESNVVDRHIRELRVKLGDDWRTPLYIETVPGQGYRFKV